MSGNAAGVFTAFASGAWTSRTYKATSWRRWAVGGPRQGDRALPRRRAALRSDKAAQHVAVGREPPPIPGEFNLEGSQTSLIDRAVHPRQHLGLLLGSEVVRQADEKARYR